MKKILLRLFIFLVFSIGFFAYSQTQFAFTKTLKPFTLRFFQHACGGVGLGHVRCNAQVVTDANNKPLVAPLPPASAYGPVQFHSAYQLPCTPGGPIASNCATPSAYTNTIAIVDAYQDPTVENDLAVYSSAYNLPPCTVANGCLQVVNENGGSFLPTVDSGWALEESLDVQIAHTICQTCKILLVEANSSSITDLGTSVNTAASMGAMTISNSYGANEFFGQTQYDTYYNHPGIAVTASSGDSGYGTEYPAAIPGVVAVGGTSLQLFTDNTYASESVWNGTGSGCSKYENAASWQTGLTHWAATACSSKRGIVDIAADADPNTGAAVYDSTPYSGSTGWWIVGGTSLASPLIASSYALAGGMPGGTLAPSILYGNQGLFHDITSGSNGNCSSIMCKAGFGYDGPSGLGSPNGIAGFVLGSATPTPTVTPTPTATPTPTPIDTTPPVVNITSPANGALVRHGSRVTINATASDNIAVAKVEFFINNKLVTTRTASPYSYNWSVPFTRNVLYTITAEAFDTSNNTATSTITVTSY